MKKWLAGLIFFVSVILLSMSIYTLMGMFGQEMKDRKGYEKLQEIYEDGERGADELRDEADGNLTDSHDDGKEIHINEGLLALHEQNSDCIAWITIEGTVIDYPVMYRPEEKNYYLHRDFFGEYSPSGSLFLSEICEPQGCDNQIIYGHHMSSGTMFAALDGYKSEDFYREHPVIRFSTLHGDEEYQVMAAFAVPVYTGKDFAYYSFSKAGTQEEFLDYVTGCKERSFYETGETARYGDRLLTLSTCEYSHKNGRMVVVARHISGR